MKLLLIAILLSECFTFIFIQLLEEKFQEINDILDDVQRDLFNQQEKLAEFAEQQRQVID
jgi:cob(I)alamin adenosyltransferase